MARSTAPTPMEAFELNMADADLLVTFARGLDNKRQKRARVEFRSRIGDALRVPRRDQKKIDCIESADAVVVIKPNSNWSREILADVRPLLRQALVAACAATETYLADVASAQVGRLTEDAKDLPKRMGKIQLTVAEWVDIQAYYKQKKRVGLHRVIKEHIRAQASTSSSQYGQILSMVGVEKWHKKIDAARKVRPGDTVILLDRVTARRNKIAHEGDRRGQSRAQLTVEEVEEDLLAMRSIVAATGQVILASPR
jgi:hypothetical protein